ncbi:MAG: Maf family protein [Planctomycetaceae bacterium]|nr:Maf family protein [Planctomycetaceae bacterium]
MSRSVSESAGGILVLGSRSPRRYELLSHLVGRERVMVRAPLDAAEAGFAGLSTLSEISGRLLEIVRTKCADVMTQLTNSGDFHTAAGIVTADTMLVARDEDGRPVVLGQPPDDDTWREVVREWFDRYLLQLPHAALTAVCIETPDGRRTERVVRTDVLFRRDACEWLEWYLDTGESRGKAGGYALQGAGSLFVERVDGSPSNVVGLPLQETGEMLRELQLV